MDAAWLARQRFGVPQSDYMPHLSLLYRDCSDAERYCAPLTCSIHRTLPTGRHQQGAHCARRQCTLVWGCKRTRRAMLCTASACVCGRHGVGVANVCRGPSARELGASCCISDDWMISHQCVKYTILAAVHSCCCAAVMLVVTFITPGPRSATIQNTSQAAMPVCPDRSGLVRLDPLWCMEYFLRPLAGERGVVAAGMGSRPIDRRCPLVSTGDGAHGSSMRPLYQPPLLSGQCTRRSYLMRALVQKTHGAAHPTPCVVQRISDRSGPSFRRTHVTTRCCGTPCLRASSSHSISSLLGSMPRCCFVLLLNKRRQRVNITISCASWPSHLLSAQQRWLLVVASSVLSSFDF